MEVEVFVAAGEGGDDFDGITARGVDELGPKEVDQILYQVGNDESHGFIARLVRAIGGTVDLHAWGLSAMAAGACPALGRGGIRGGLAAIREGGFTEGLRYMRAVREGGLESLGETDPLDFGLSLNRSIVRHADAFLVGDEDMARRVEEDRNQLTPVGVVDRESELPKLAEQYADLLAGFPPAHAARKRLIVAFARANERRHSARDGARGV